MRKIGTFEYELSHRLHIEVSGGRAVFDESKQEIFLTGAYISPNVELQSMTVKAHYPLGAASTIADAIKSIVNVDAKVMPAERRAQSKTIVSADEIGEDVTKERIDEAAIPDMSIDVITDMLNVPVDVTLDGNEFSFSTRSEDMSRFITFRQSKKMKVFINGKEFAPKQELEFVKKVFPQIDMTVRYK